MRLTRTITTIGMALATLWMASAVAGAAVSSVGIARKVTVTLSTDVVKPKTVIAIEAIVTPHEPGRTVLFEFATSGKRFRHLGFARTNAKGVATLHRAFGALGTIRIRPEVIATGTESAVSGAVVHEQVVSVLPFVLPAGAELSLGQSSGLVIELQQRLSALGYWLGSPGGYFGDATQQAVYAFEKAAGIARSGVVGPQFVSALNDDVVPVPRTKSGNAIDVDLERDLLEIVHNGQLAYVLNTSTGGGYTYTQGGATNVAITPRGVFQTERVVNGTVIDTLGTLWRPRFFVGGYAIHGDSYVPPVPESHGCVRVSNEAINWVWANNLDPIGETVWVY